VSLLISGSTRFSCFYVVLKRFSQVLSAVKIVFRYTFSGLDRCLGWVVAGGRFRF
jgi:hypothetical protein